MCGRFTLGHSAEDIAKAFGLTEIPDWQPRYNLAPTQTIPAIVEPPETHARAFKPLRWGLIPSWSKDSGIGAKLINARAETVREKPSFRDAFKRRRCLIVADGFYEWKKQSGKKQPFHFRLTSGEPFAFAGLWERWHSPDGDTIETGTIITTIANDLAATVHDRMPVILQPDEYDRWLDPTPDLDDLQALLNPYLTDAMTAFPVSLAVNSPTNDSPECVNPLSTVS